MGQNLQHTRLSISMQMQYNQYRSKNIWTSMSEPAVTRKIDTFQLLLLPETNVTVLESRQSLVIVLGTAGHLLVCKWNRLEGLQGAWIPPPSRLHCHGLFGDLLCALQGAFLVPCQTETQIQTYSISVTTHVLFISRQRTLKHSVMISHS